MNILADLKKIRLFVIDVDGVLTDGGLLLLDDGQMARRMNIKDGYALQLAVKKGYTIFIISGAESPAVRLRLEKLGIRHVHTGVVDKQTLLLELLNEHKFTREEILYIGDDMPDLAPMKEAGVACAPADAVAQIREAADYISPKNGGEGCVRDVIEKVMTLNGDWE